jgi:hypothetical protein
VANCLGTNVAGSRGGNTYLKTGQALSSAIPDVLGSVSQLFAANGCGSQYPPFSTGQPDQNPLFAFNDWGGDWSQRCCMGLGDATRIIWDRCSAAVFVVVVVAAAAAT